jgi:energy-coupling factor transport system ATP-binding protein
VLFSTHDLATVASSAGRYLGFRAGRIVSRDTIKLGTRDIVDDKVFSRRREPPPPPPALRVEPQGDAPVLDAQDIHFRYPHGGGELLGGVSIILGASELLIVRGPNGSGKTTLLHLLAGILRPSKGRINICGMEPGDLPMGQRGEFCGLVFQNPEHQFLNDDVDSELSSGVSAPKRSFPEERAERLRWFRSVLGLTEGKRDPHSLSLGEKKILTLVTSTLPAPRLLLLDEPELGLDPVQKEVVANMLEAMRTHWGMAMVMVTHDDQMGQQMKDAKFLNLAGI